MIILGILLYFFSIGYVVYTCMNKDLAGTLISIGIAFIASMYLGVVKR